MSLWDLFHQLECSLLPIPFHNSFCHMGPQCLLDLRIDELRIIPHLVVCSDVTLDCLPGRTLVAPLKEGVKFNFVEQYLT